ncbi:hypothetical protein C8R44DRAFT_880878 [Mycena epipterygia]|nr:hypothetical protein C8R44DRAFT_880878 [Mycena epipterygia]
MLELRRSTLLAPVEVYRVALVPHEILPIDVLREIFICAVQDSSLEPFLNGLASRDSVPLEIRLIICQVCLHWRFVALETHDLWSNVQVYFSEDFVRILEVLDIWLSRSAQCPLILRAIGMELQMIIASVVVRFQQR